MVMPSGTGGRLEAGPYLAMEVSIQAIGSMATERGNGVFNLGCGCNS